MPEHRYRVGIDTGGTFTDVVAVEEATGAITVTKTASTPANPAVGFMTGLTKVLGLIGAGPGSITSVAHGTTVATNRLIEGKVDGLALVTNAGYEHMLEIARQSVPDGYGNSYFWVKPPRIVPVDRVYGVGGRLAYDGSEIRPFDEASAVRAAEALRAAEIRAVGVCFLHSYAEPAHELRMREVLADIHPDAVVSLSCEVLAEYREYERAVTTLVDAAVKPSIRDYVAGIAAELAAYAGRDVPFAIMKSNGGVLSAAEVVRQPITTVLSGPAAGALGAARIATGAGFPSVVTCDGGGTSTDVALVLDGAPTLTTEGSIGAYPTKIAMIDVVTIGAGGGSIARVSPEGTLKVGPESAGADPGPMCYGTGGDEATVTDAHVVLGRIPPSLLGGEVPLDAALAKSGMVRLGEVLGLGWERAAAGVLEISAWNQANAIRGITVQRGLDVRDFHLVTFGGSGSLLVCRLLDILAAPGAIVPRDPGNLSAYGLLAVDVRLDLVRTHVRRHLDLRADEVVAVLADLTGDGTTALLAEGFPEDRHVMQMSADLRYAGQAYEVTVPVPLPAEGLGGIDGPALDGVAERFHDEHRSLYGYDLRASAGQEVEWVNLRVAAIGPVSRPTLQRIDPSVPSRPTAATRAVRFDDWRQARVVDRADLGAGDRVVGPAVVEEFSATVPIHPGYVADVDALGNLLITRLPDEGPV